jgi:hypothetical protein
MAINSRQKGKRGELTVAKLLTHATGCEWRRTAQVRGKNDGAPDIECMDPQYAGVWVEVKDRAGWYVGCKPWADAWKTTCDEAYARNKVPVMIWRVARGKFAATVNASISDNWRTVTIDDLLTALKLAA